MALQVLLDGRDITALASSLTFSSVDPGGYEACSFTLPPGWPQPSPGADIVIREGLETAWEGEVEDPGPRQDQGRVQGQVQGVGHGVKLKDNPYQCIYIDQDLSRWAPMGTSRRLNLISANLAVFDFTSRPDTANGQPSIVTGLTGAWAQTPRSEAWYDAGPGLTIAALYYAFQASTSISPIADASWTWHVYFASDDVATAFDDSGDLSAGSSGAAYFAPSQRRYVILSLGYADPGGSDAVNYELSWRPAAYGPHGLTRRGSDPGGFYAEDIAVHALAQAAGLKAGVIDASGFIVGHSVYRDPTMPEQVVDDMGKLTGFHWGVWESQSLTDDTPRLDFRARPSTATAVVSREDCEGLQLSERRSQLYDTCLVTYTDAAGTPGEAAVKIANPRLPTGVSRTLGPLNMGVGGLVNAIDYATAALELAQAGQRGGGPFTLPGTVKLPGGGSKPAHLLKAGLDRLKITDLPDSGPWTDLDTRRLDTFRVKRVETSVQNGVPRTTGEVDDGADLLEVLNARHAIAQTITGAG